MEYTSELIAKEAELSQELNKIKSLTLSKLKTDIPLLLSKLIILEDEEKKINSEDVLSGLRQEKINITYEINQKV